MASRPAKRTDCGAPSSAQASAARTRRSARPCFKRRVPASASVSASIHAARSAAPRHASSSAARTTLPKNGSVAARALADSWANSHAHRSASGRFAPSSMATA